MEQYFAFQYNQSFPWKKIPSFFKVQKLKSYLSKYLLKSLVISGVTIPMITFGAFILFPTMPSLPIIILLSIIYSIFFFIIIGILLFLLFLYIKQDVLLYMNYINKDIIYLPSRFNLPFDDIYLKTEDGVEIHSWFIKYREPGKNIYQLFEDTPTIIFFHSNSSNMSYRLQNIKDLYHSLKCNILCIDYRGYGLSKGYSSEKGLKLDALAAWEYIQSRKDLNLRKVFILGRGLGGAVAISLAYEIQKRKEFVSGVIIENTFTNIPDMIDVTVPFLKYFKWACSNQWNSKEIIQKLSSRLPILFISGLKDLVIPPSMTRDLFDKSKSKFKIMKIFPEGTHNYTWMQNDYFISLQEFIQSVIYIRM